MSYTTIVSGRTKRQWYLKAMPWWWLYNSDSPSPPEGYWPSAPNAMRTLAWYFRNPLHNLTFYVIGVADRNYVVSSNTEDPLAAFADKGWKWSLLQLSFLRLPYLSYRSDRLELYLGWQPSGKLGARLTLR